MFMSTSECLSRRVLDRHGSDPEALGHRASSTKRLQGRTIVLTTQILTEAEELCDDILIMNRGRQIARGDLNHLKTLVERLYEVSVTFERIPDQLTQLVEAFHPLELTVAHNTARMKLREEETRVLELVSILARQARLLRIEINGASLEDIFVELTQRSGAKS